MDVVKISGQYTQAGQEKIQFLTDGCERGLPIPAFMWWCILDVDWGMDMLECHQLLSQLPLFYVILSLGLFHFPSYHAWTVPFPRFLRRGLPRNDVEQSRAPLENLRQENISLFSTSLSDILKETAFSHSQHLNRSDSSFQNHTITMDPVHYFFMGMAIREAESAAKRGEVPVGAIIVRNSTCTTWNLDKGAKQTSHHQNLSNEIHFEVVSNGSNRVEMQFDASAHAELLALRQASRRLFNWRLYNTTLYTTLEPCPMCLAAAQAFRVDTIVFGAPDLRLGAVTTHMNMLDMAHHPFHNISNIVSGVRQDECAELLRRFFRKRRKEGKKARKAYSTMNDLVRINENK